MRIDIENQDPRGYTPSVTPSVTLVGEMARIYNAGLIDHRFRIVEIVAAEAMRKWLRGPVVVETKEQVAKFVNDTVNEILYATGAVTRPRPSDDPSANV